jgi:peptidoglycan/xylan/chitin deacetylase (PgdA/CDA1 family)
MVYILLLLPVLSLLYILWHRRYKSKNNRFYPILSYHKVTDKFEWGITRVTPRSFKEQVSFLKEEGFSITDLDEIEKNRDNSKLVAFTFDDGYQSVYQNAFPVLKENNSSATIFLVAGHIGKDNLWEAGFGRRFRHLSWEEIEEMKNYGFHFGSHTVNHPDLTKLTKRQLEYELRSSKEVIEDKLNQKVKYLSYPFGRHNQQVREQAKKTGYQAAFSLTSEKSFDPFAIGRIGVYLFDTPLSLRIKLNPGGLFWIEDLKGWIINQFSAGTALVKRYK